MSGESRAQRRAAAPANNGAMRVYTGTGYQKHELGEKKYLIAAIVEGGNEASFVLDSSFDIFHVYCE